MSVSLSKARPPHFGQAKPAGSSSLRAAGVPGVGRVLLEHVRHVARELGAQQHLAAALAVEGRDRHAPQPLARDAPVGPGGDHVVDALLAPGGQPAALRDRRKRALAQRGLALVEGDEPLLGGTEDDRVPAAPADRVGVRVRGGLQQGARPTQELDDHRVGVEHALPGEALHLGQEAASLVHRAVDVQPVANARQVVVPAVAGRRMHHAGAGVERDVVREESGRVAIQPGMPEAQVLELAALRLGQRRAQPGRRTGASSARAPARLGSLLQRLGEHEHVAGALDRVERVVCVGVERERQVRRQRPRRRRPDHGEHALAGEAGVPGREAVAVRLGEGEAHVDRRAHVVLVVLHLGLGERRAARDTPVDGLLRLVDEPSLDEQGELAHDRRLVEGRHREVGVAPLAQHAQPLELAPLHADVLLGVGPAGAAELDRRQLALLRAEAAVHLQLDREAVAVPARAVRRVEASHRAAAHDHVLEDLVERRPEVDVAVRVRGAVVQHEAGRPARALRSCP